MEKQEIFDTVAKALLKQGCAAMQPNGDCAYINETGQRCAIGWLIPDDVIEKVRLYSGSIHAIIKNASLAALMPSYFEENLEFLSLLQSAHDTNSYRPLEEWQEKWKKQMLQIAQVWHLSPKVLET